MEATGVPFDSTKDHEREDEDENQVVSCSRCASAFVKDGKICWQCVRRQSVYPPVEPPRQAAWPLTLEVLAGEDELVNKLWRRWVTAGYKLSSEEGAAPDR